MSEEFWRFEPAIFSFICLLMWTLGVIALARFIRLASRLYFYRGDSLSPERIINGDVDADALATYALSKKSPRRVPRQDRLHSGRPADPVAAGNGFGLAESRFVYCCEDSAADVESTKRASWLMLLLSLMAAAFGAIPTIDGNCNGKDANCFEASVVQLLRTFGLQVSASAVIYFVSGCFARTLSKRRAEWMYFFARPKHGG